MPLSLIPPMGTCGPTIDAQLIETVPARIWLLTRSDRVRSRVYTDPANLN